MSFYPRRTVALCVQRRMRDDVQLGLIVDQGDVRSGSIATEMGDLRDVRFPPVSDRTADIAGGPVSAISRRAILFDHAKLSLAAKRKRPPFAGALSRRHAASN